MNRLGSGSMARLPILASVADVFSWSVPGVNDSASDSAGKARRGRCPGSGESQLIRFWHSAGRRAGSSARAARAGRETKWIVMISRSKPARSFSHIRLNVVGLFQKRSPRPINRHSLSVNTVCCCA